MSDAATSGYNWATIPAQRPSSNTFLFRVNIFILGAMALIFLYRLPRGIALFGSSEWFSGHILRHIPYRPSRTASRSRRIVQAHRSNSASSPTNPQGGGTTEESHTLAYHYNQQSFKRLDARGREIQMQYPTHIASCPRFLRWALPTLRYRITPDYSVGQGILLMAYFWILFYTTVFNSNFFVDYNRVGWIATAQLPFVMAYGTKNNILGMLWGMGYERLNYIHRFAGRMVVIGANLHGIGFAYRWSLAGTFTVSVRAPQNMWGLVALICLDVLWLFSLAYWRNHFYNLFIVTHVTCFSVLLPGLWFHKPRLIPYALATVSFFALDYLLRLVKTRVVTATIRPLSELDVTRIEVPNINAGWRAGQHVRVRILSTGMGWFGWSEMHPFTIASVGVSDSLGESVNGNGRKTRGVGGEEGMVLMCKKTGRWTNRLFEIAKMSGYVDGWMGREVKVWIEGPYGGPGHTNFSSFSAAVIVVAGSGITFALSVVKDLVEKDIKGMSRLKAIELICVVPDHTFLTPLLPTLTTLIHRSVFTPLRISIHYTRASATQPSIPSIPGLSISPGRPRIAKIIDHAVSKALVVGTRFDHLMDVNATMEVGQAEKSKNKKKDDNDHHDASRSNSHRDGSRSHGSHGHGPSRSHSHGHGTRHENGSGSGSGSGSGKSRKLEVDVEMEEAIEGHREKEDIHEITGVIVGVCGPVELGKDVVNAVGSIDRERRDRVGGIEVHEEVFGW